MLVTCIVIANYLWCAVHCIGFKIIRLFFSSSNFWLHSLVCGCLAPLLPVWITDSHGRGKFLCQTKVAFCTSAVARWAMAFALPGTKRLWLLLERWDSLRVATESHLPVDKQLRSSLSPCSLYWQFLHFIIEVNEPICNLRRGERDECIQNPVTQPISY